MIYWVL